MEIRKASDNVAIYSDGRRLRVIHNLGDEFFLDLSLKSEVSFNLDDQAQETLKSIEPAFEVMGFCSRSGEGMHCLSRAILQFGIFEEYIKDNQDDLIDWWNNLGGEEND